MLCLVALVVALVVWALNSGGGSGGSGSGAPAGSHTPIATITAGPAPSGTHISGRPGGRDTAPSGDGSSDGGTNAGSSGSTAGSSGGGASGGSASGGTADGSSSSGGDVSGGAGGSSSGGNTANDAPLPAGSSLPDCSPGSVQLTLASVQNSYGPGEAPQFRLTAANSGSVSCKIDFGPENAVFTVTGAADNSHVWASDDCPKTGAYPLQVPAHSHTAFTLRWDGLTSSPHCASPKGRQATPGTYLVAAQLPGYPGKQQSFVLSAD